MRHLIIPDVHGRPHWRSMIEKEGDGVDKIVFLGDYVDSFDRSNDEIITGLKDIIALKKADMSKVVLLLGNHDAQYLVPPDLGSNPYLCSGYRPEAHADLYEILKTNKSLFQNAYQRGKAIMSHAGIHHGWFHDYFKGDIKEDIADQLNNPKNRGQIEAIHQVGHRRGGWKPMGGILWADKEELRKPLKGFNQIVGHTSGASIRHQVLKNSQVWFIDCPPKEDDNYLILNIKE